MKKEVLHEKLEFENIRDLVEKSAEMYGEKVYLSYRNASKEIEKITFVQFRDDVRALACEMLSMGCAGKHCALIGKPSSEWALVYFAAQSIGAVLVPMDRDWPADDLAETAKAAGAEYLFCEAEIADKAAVIAERVSLAAPTVFLQAKEEERALSSLILAGKEKFDRAPETYFDAPIDADKMSLLVLTSGTTGKGKGVMLSQNNILSVMTDIIPYIDFSDKTVGVLPLHHTYGSSVMLVGHAIIGSEVYISAGLRYVQKELKEQKPGHLVIVPLYLETFYRKILANVKESGKEKQLKMLIKMSNAMRKTGVDLRRKLFSGVLAAFGGEVRTVISGGAPINPEIQEFFESIGITVLNGYGITECAPIIAVNRSRRIVPGSVGPVLDIDNVVIDEPNEDGEGEILVSGPNVMLGYYNDKDATAEAITEEGYFRTGDYGKLDENNVLYITGRKKNLIILSNGKNVYPEEIENELSATPGVLEIVVYEGQSRRGISHNAIVAEIYPDMEYLEKNGITDVQAHIKPYVDAYNRSTVPYKKISVIKIRKKEFPKNTLRKIMRFKMDMTID